MDSSRRRLTCVKDQIGSTIYGHGIGRSQWEIMLRVRESLWPTSLLAYDIALPDVELVYDGEKSICDVESVMYHSD